MIEAGSTKFKVLDYKLSNFELRTNFPYFAYKIICMRFQNIIFDLDGTLTNPQDGILNSIKYALRSLHYQKIPDVIPLGFIGPPLQQSFKKVFGFNEKQTERAVELFREYYGKHGLYENIPYDGIEQFISYLSSEGKSLFIATSKLEKYAWEIIRHFEFDRYITDLTGAGYQGNHTKAELIQDIIERYRLNTEETVMIGDTAYDIEGAQQANVKCIAVGYGFTELSDLEAYNPDYIVEDVEDLIEMFYE